MSSLKTNSTEANSGVYNFASHRHNHQEDIRDKSRSLDEIVVSLQREKSYVDKVSKLGEEYVVETYIKVNNREWYFSSEVKRNGQEIKNDEKLIREIRCRKPAPQADQTESRWIMFVKEAAKIHLEKYEEVNRRIRMIDLPKRNVWKKLSIGSGLFLILAMICFGIYFLYKHVVVTLENDRHKDPVANATQQTNELTPNEIKKLWDAADREKSD